MIRGQESKTPLWEGRVAGAVTPDLAVDAAECGHSTADPRPTVKTRSKPPAFRMGAYLSERAVDLPELGGPAYGQGGLRLEPAGDTGGLGDPRRRSVSLVNARRRADTGACPLVKRGLFVEGIAPLCSKPPP